MKKGKVVALILILVGVVVFAIAASGIKIRFIENYTYNFKVNMMGLAKNLNITLPDGVVAFLEDLPEIEPEEETEPETEASPTPNEQTEEIEDAEDIVEVEFEDLDLKEGKVKNTPVALESASTYKYSEYKDYILCVNETSVTAYDQNGKTKWAIGIHMSDPILDVNDDYYMIAERGGKKVCLFEGKKRLYEQEADGEIRCASISSGNDVVLVTDKEYYKGAVLVINKSGDKVFSWNSGHDDITDADIKKGTRTLAVSFVNMDSGVTSKVATFNISSGEKKAETEFKNSIVYDVEFLGDVINVFADDKVVGLSEKCKIFWEEEYKEKKLITYRAEETGYKILKIEENNASEIEILTSRGKNKAKIVPETAPDSVDIRSGRICYNTGRNIVFSGLSGKSNKTYLCSRDIKDIHIIDNNSVMVVYSSGLDFINF